MRRNFVICATFPAIFFLACGSPVRARGETPPAAGSVELRQHGDGALEISPSLRHEARAALERGLGWLKQQQQEDGHWSNPGHPALTALPVWALIGGSAADGDAVERGIASMLRHAQDDGGIYVPRTSPQAPGGLSNYNTAIAMVALHLRGDPELAPVVRRARRFVARSQHLGGDIYHGGMGYDAGTGRTYADLSNSYIAYEAMRLTESVEDQRPSGEARADLDWAATRAFIQRTHNHPDFNPSAWPTNHPDEKGGFAYHPDQTRAGTFEDEDGVVRFRSMPGMTYAGLLSYIYAEVDRTDPRVEATINWVIRNWTLDGNNPPSGGTARHDTQDEREGLFYLYNVMSKGLAAYGQDVFHPEGRLPFNWRVHLIKRLLSLQRIEPDTGHGYWVNDVGRYWEADPVLVTSYALIALQVALGE